MFTYNSRSSLLQFFYNWCHLDGFMIPGLKSSNMLPFKNRNACNSTLMVWADHKLVLQNRNVERNLLDSSIKIKFTFTSRNLRCLKTEQFQLTKSDACHITTAGNEVNVKIVRIKNIKSHFYNAHDILRIYFPPATCLRTSSFSGYLNWLHTFAFQNIFETVNLHKVTAFMN